MDFICAYLDSEGIYSELLIPNQPFEEALDTARGFKRAEHGIQLLHIRPTTGTMDRLNHISELLENLDVPKLLEAFRVFQRQYYYEF